jgi:hypothetical protein
MGLVEKRMVSQVLFRLEGKAFAGAESKFCMDQQKNRSARTEQECLLGPLEILRGADCGILYSERQGTRFMDFLARGSFAIFTTCDNFMKNTLLDVDLAYQRVWIGGRKDEKTSTVPEDCQTRTLWSPGFT